jgi:hypothetical protein
MVDIRRDQAARLAFWPARALRICGLAVPAVFVVFATSVPRLVAQTAVVSAASYQDTIAPGSLATVFGSNLAQQTVTSSPAADGSYPKQLGGTTVTVGGTDADLYYVSPSQINFVVPLVSQYGSLNVVVGSGAQTTATCTAKVAPTAPAVFTTDASGTGFGAILNAIDFTQPPFNLTTVTQAAGQVTTIVAVFGTGFRFAGGTAVSSQSGDVSGHVTAQVSNPSGITWTLPVSYAGPAPGYEGLDQINVQLMPNLDTTSDLKLTIFADSTPSNSVYLWLQRSTPLLVTSALPASASPGATIGLSGTGFLDSTSFQASVRQYAVFDLPNGLEVSAKLSNATVLGGQVVVPSIPLDSSGNYYYGTAQLCALLDLQRSCLPNGISIISPPPTGQPVGAALLSAEQAKVSTTLAALSPDLDPAVTAAVTASAQEGLAVLQQRIADATAGHPDSIQVADLDGNTTSIVLDLPMIGQIESLIVGAQTTGAAVSGAPNAAEHASPRAQDSVTCGLSDEAWAQSMRTNYLDIQGEEDIINRLQNAASTILQECLQAIQGDGQSALTGACYDAAALVSKMEGFVDLVLEAANYTALGADLVMQRQAIFLQGMQINGTNPAEASLSSGTPSQPLSVTGQMSARSWQATTDQAIEAFVSDIIGRVMPPQDQIDTDAGNLSLLCAGCAKGYVSLAQDLSTYFQNLITQQVSDYVATIPFPAPATRTIRLGLMDLNTSFNGDLSTKLSLACQDSDTSTISLVQPTATGTSSVTFNPGPGGLLFYDQSNPPTATLIALGNVSPPNVATDRSSYSVTDVMQLSGKGFAPGTTLNVSLQGNMESTSLANTVLCGSDGTFQEPVSFPAGTSPGNYSVFASSINGSQSASAPITILASPIASFAMNSGGQSAQSGDALNLGVAQGGTVTVTFDGSSSTAGSGSIKTWLWQNNGTALPCSGSTCSYAFSSVTPTNSVKLTVTSAAGQSASATGEVNLSVESAPPGPFTLTLEAPVCDQTAPTGPAVRLDWTLASNATNYDVYRNGAVYSPAGVSVSGTTFYNNAGVVAGQTYSYFVRAKNIAGTTDSNTGTVLVPSNICQAPPTLPTLQSITISPSSITAGSSATVTITLSGPAPSGGAVVGLSVSNMAFPVPSTLTVPAGQSTASFSESSGATITATTTTIVTATYNGGSQTASVTVTVTGPGLPTLIGFSISPSTVTSGANATLSFTLTGPAPSGGATITLSSNNAVLPVPATYSIPAGQSTTSFSVQSSALITSTTITTVTATYNGGTQTASVTVTPATPSLPTLTGFSINPSTVASGASATLSFTLSAPAPSGGATISLSSNNMAFPVPSNFTVPAGQSTTSVSAQSSTTITATATAVVMATYNGGSLSASVTVAASTGSGLALSSLSVTPSTVTAGSFTTLSVSVNGLAPGGTAVSIQSSNQAAYPAPSSVAIPSGYSTNGVSVQAGSLATTTVVTVTASFGGVTKSATVTVNPSAGTNQIQVAPPAWPPVFTVGDSAATIPLSITAQNGATINGTTSVTTNSGGAWLTVSGRTSDTWTTAPSGSTSESLSANPAGLSAGTYTGTVTVSAPAASNPTTTIPVTMTVRNALVITTTSPLPTATGGVAYSYQLQPVGGSGTSWALQLGSNLPNGLTLSPSGLISGTPPTSFSGQVFVFTVVLTDAISGRSVAASLSLTVQAPITVTTNGALSPQFTLGLTYSEPPGANNSISYLASGGAAPYTWAASGLPPGLRIDAATGFIVGTPTQAGPFPATITATDSQGRSGSGSFSFVVTVTPLLIAPTTLPAGTVGVAYSQFLNAGNGSNSGYQWTVQGTLPPGLTAQTPSGCVPATGCLLFSGTPTQAGTFNFTVKLTDSVNDTLQPAYSIIINAGTPPQITSTYLPLGTVGQAYSFAFAATGGSGSGYQWSFVGNSPDQSLQLSSAGVLSGTSMVANDCPSGPDVWVGSQYPTTYFQVQVTDSAGQKNSGQFCLPSYYPTTQITSVNPATVVANGQSYTITVSGNNIRSTGQILMGGVSMATAFNAGALSFALTPKSGSALGGFNEGAYALKIVQPYTAISNTNQTLTIYDPVPALSSVNAVLNNSSQPCQANQSCQLVVNGSGLMNGTTYTIVQTGTNLIEATVPSTPVPWNTITTSAFSAAAGTYTLQVSNANQPGGGPATATVQFSIASAGNLSVTPNVFQPTFTAGSTTPATVGFAIANLAGGALSGSITAITNGGGSWLTVDGRTSYSWTAPETVNVTANPAALSAGTYTGTLTVTSPNATNSPITISVTMTILTPLQVTTTSLPVATWGQPYSFQLQASGGSGFVWTLQSGSLPSGLTLSSSGLISGTLPTASSLQSFTFDAGVTNSTSQTASANLTLTVQPPISIMDNVPTSFQFIVGIAYVEPPNGNNSITFQASGGTAPYTWSATGLPAGLSFDHSSGIIIGTPTQPGTFPAVITATDSTGRTGTANFSLVAVTTPLLITPATLPAGTVGVAYSQFLNAGGGSNAGYQWTVQGSLPPGLTATTPSGCAPATGCFLFSGTPTQAGTFNFTVKVTDSLNDTLQPSYSIIINAGTPPQITSTYLTLATVGQSYSFAFTATGGSGSGYQWSFVGSSPDPSLQLSSGGVLSGTSTVANDCPSGPDVWVGSQYPTTYFQVQVTDSAGQRNSGQFCLPAYYPATQITAVNPPTVVANGQSHTITVSGNNIRSTGQVYVGSALVPTTFSGGALSFTLAPETGSVLGPLNEGTYPVKIVQPYTAISNTNQTLTIYDPVPALSSVNAVLNNSSQPCQANQSCQLVVNGSGLMYGTTYTIVQTGTNLIEATVPSTPVPWNTITTSAFSAAAGTYTLQVSNANQPGGGPATATTSFVVQ